MVITTERDGIAKLIQVELEGDVWRDFPFPSIVCQDGNRSSMTQCQKTKIKKLNKTDNSKYSLLAKKGFRDGKYGILFWSGVFWWSADPLLGLFGGMIKAELPEWGLTAGVVFLSHSLESSFKNRDSSQGVADFKVYPISIKWQLN